MMSQAAESVTRVSLDIPPMPLPHPDRNFLRFRRQRTTKTGGIEHHMKDVQNLLIALEQTAHRVDAIETLAGCLAAGIRAGVAVDPDHLYMLLHMHAEAIKSDLHRLASNIERRWN